MNIEMDFCQDILKGQPFGSFQILDFWPQLRKHAARYDKTDEPWQWSTTVWADQIWLMVQQGTPLLTKSRLIREPIQSPRQQVNGSSFNTRAARALQIAPKSRMQRISYLQPPL